MLDLDLGLVNRESLASGELTLSAPGAGDVEIIRDLLEEHLAHTGSDTAERLLTDLEGVSTRFTKIVPRDYAAVMTTREEALAEGLDPDGDVVWNRILEVTHG